MKGIAHKDGTRPPYAGTPARFRLVALIGILSGLVLLVMPHVDKSEFRKLTQVSGKIEEVRRLSRPGSANPSVVVTLSGASGRHSIRIDSYDWHPAVLGRLSLGAIVDAWVDEMPTGELFAWQLERNGNFVVGYRDRLETSRRMQHALVWIGWPLLFGGVLALLWFRHERGSRDVDPGVRQPAGVQSSTCDGAPIRGSRRTRHVV